MAAKKHLQCTYLRNQWSDRLHFKAYLYYIDYNLSLGSLYEVRDFSKTPDTSARPQETSVSLQETLVRLKETSEDLKKTSKELSKTSARPQVASGDLRKTS